MKSQFCITILVLYSIIHYIYTVNCEWVEITPIKNDKYQSDSTITDSMTTENYENIMKSPIPKSEITTTPAYLPDAFTSYKTESDKDNIEERTTTELPNENITTTEFPGDYLDQEEAESSGIEEFIPFLKTIQTNLLKFKKAHKSKMSVLKHLRDHLLTNIKGLITRLWKPKVSSEARGYHDDDNHMDFPSNEGALMTIGFLTFAVFLIKLVIKLIHTLKYKQQVYSMTTTTTAASVVFVKRRKREEEQEEMNKILQYIEEF